MSTIQRFNVIPESVLADPKVLAVLNEATRNAIKGIQTSRIKPRSDTPKADKTTKKVTKTTAKDDDDDDDDKDVAETAAVIDTAAATAVRDKKKSSC
jgi:hypothetical protein